LTIRQSGTIRGTVTKFRQSLLNQKIEKLDRVGKLLIGQLSNGLFLLIHLKMTGQLIYRYGEKMISGGHPWPELKNDLPNKFTRVVVGFADGSSLFFNDLRGLVIGG
jgi:formamidopyrimidine-DNA glycosylase